LTKKTGQRNKKNPPKPYKGQTDTPKTARIYWKDRNLRERKKEGIRTECFNNV